MVEAHQPGEPFTVDDFLAPANDARLDAIVAEVFGMMLGFRAQSIPLQPRPPATDSVERTALVGFSGAMRGLCEVRMNFDAAHAIATAMLGGSEPEEDSIDDAVGEICNMLAGGWKNSVPALSSGCSLSPPTVVSGRSYKVHISSPSMKVCRSYAFGLHTFHLTVHRLDVRT